MADAACLSVKKVSGSSYINHFVQPDTIIPDWTNPQALNRYSYVTNRPVNFNDPSGHMLDEGQAGNNKCTNKNYCENGKPKHPKRPEPPTEGKSEDTDGGGSSEFYISNLCETQYCDIQSADLSVLPGGKYDQYIELDEKRSCLRHPALMLICGLGLGANAAQYVRTNGGYSMGRVITYVGYSGYSELGPPPHINTGVDIEGFGFYNHSPDTITSVVITTEGSQNGHPIASAADRISVEIPSNTRGNVFWDPSLRIPSGQDLVVTIMFDIYTDGLSGTSTHILIP